MVPTSGSESLLLPPAREQKKDSVGGPFREKVLQATGQYICGSGTCCALPGALGVGQGGQRAHPDSS